MCQTSPKKASALVESADCNDSICFSSFPYRLQKIILRTERPYPFLSGWNIFIAKFSSSGISPVAQARFTEQQAPSHSLSGHNKSSCCPEPSCHIRFSEECWAQTETPRSFLPFLEPRLLKTKKHYVGVSLQPSGLQHNQKWKIPPKSWKGGARLKRVLTSVANGPSHALLSWFVWVHPHLVPRCVRTTTCRSCCCRGPDSCRGSRAVHLEQWLYSFRCPKRGLSAEGALLQEASSEGREGERTKRKKCTSRTLVPMEKKKIRK